MNKPQKPQPIVQPQNPKSVFPQPKMIEGWTNINIQQISHNYQYTQLNYSSEFGLLGINNQMKLQRFQNNQWLDLVDNVHPHSPIATARGRISLVDKDQKYIWFENNKKTVSNIVTSLHSQAVHLGAANIIIAKKTDNSYTLTRIEKTGNEIKIVNQSNASFS
ncbi:hypothetical protein [Mycoplasmoides fastidiosum]|nr:hypothetical protein [Mycoplasmoides fastidiosum]UUD37354.1 hypothetical protein NPA10_02095 [Mycoplasmoides fastidiosum]